MSGSLTRFVVSALFMTIPLSATAKEKAPPSEPMDHPDWSEARKKVETAIRNSLFDPSAAQITWTSGFKWSAVKPVIGSKTWGWVGCVAMNGKNQFGAYVGAVTYWAFYGSGGDVAAGPAGNSSLMYGVLTQCDGPPVPLQVELTMPASPVPGVPIADELAKLAGLLDKGVITRAEFDAEKARLLAR